MQRTLSSDISSKKGGRVLVAGWVHARRSHGKIVFLDIRDRAGLTQVVFTPQAEEAYEAVQEVRPEWVVQIEGSVQERPDSMKNPNLLSGDVELSAESLHVYSQAETPPFPLDTDGYEIGEEHRLKYRYLDLRRERLHRNLEARHKIVQFIRDFLSQEGFVEIETPLLTKSTPEGARDFLVPSRLQPGKFYALPQSPQQFKQLLQVAGIERYFQIARALRDEDPRGDRQAEHTQLDLEMSFVEREDVLSLTERLFTSLVQELFPEKKIFETPFPRLTYAQAMEKYQSDKPDLRNEKDPHVLAFAFVTDFPAFEWVEESKRWQATHNPFTKPAIESIDELKHPESVLSHQYDLVLNGFEIGSGSIRTDTPELLAACFEVMGYAKEQIESQFGHMLQAFRYGVPPHGGIATGIDRICAVLFGEPNIREVMAFPKTGDNRDLMMNAPSEVAEEQLSELHIQLKHAK